MTKEEFYECRTLCSLMGKKPEVDGFSITTTSTHNNFMGDDWVQCNSINLYELELDGDKLVFPEFIDAVSRFCTILGDITRVKELCIEHLSYVGKGSFLELTHLKRVYIGKQTYLSSYAFDDGVEIIRAN